MITYNFLKHILIYLLIQLLKLNMSNEDFKYDNHQDNEDMPGGFGKDINEHRQPQNIKLLSNNRQTKLEPPQNQSRKISTQTPSKNKLVEQHIKLKSQLKELASKMDQILQKQRQRKNKKHTNPIQQDQRVIELKKQLRQQQIRIQKNKNQLIKLRKNLDNKYDINKIVQKENELKHLKKQLQALQEEKQSLEKIRKTQKKAIESGEDKETKNKIEKMQAELRQLIQKTKKQTQVINEKEKQVRKLHQAYIIKQQKVKEIQNKMKDKKSSNEDINQYAISQLQDEIKELEKQRSQIEKEGNEKIRSLQRQRKQLKHQLQKRKLILQEKQKELRLNQMKQKEIHRLINSQTTQQASQSRVQKQSKGDQKRVIAKKGRQAPKIDPVEDEDIIQENQPQKQAKKPLKKQKQDYGTSANIDNDN